MTHLKIMFSLALITMLGFAGPPVRAAEPDPEGVKVARQLLEATHAAALGDQIMTQVIKAYSSGLTQVNPGKGKEVEEILNQILVPEFRAAMPDLMEQTARTYAGNFTVAELKQLLAFYNSEIGRKYIGKLPDLVRQQSVVGQAFAQQVVGRIREKMLKALQEKGLQKPQGI